MTHPVEALHVTLLGIETGFLFHLLVCDVSLHVTLLGIETPL